jgi:hypothetical protein
MSKDLENLRMKERLVSLAEPVTGKKSGMPREISEVLHGQYR